MTWRTYRFYFGQSEFYSHQGNLATTLKEPRPTSLTFKARSQEEADTKMLKLAHQIGLLGTLRAVKEV